MNNLEIEEGGEESTYCITQTESDDVLSLFGNVESRNNEVRELVVPEEHFVDIVNALIKKGCYSGVTNQSQLVLPTETNLRNKIEVSYNELDLFGSPLSLLDKNETTEFNDHQEDSDKIQHGQQKPIISMFDQQNELTLVDYLTSSTGTASTSNCLLSTETSSMEVFDSDRFMKVSISNDNEKSAAQVSNEKLSLSSDWDEGSPTTSKDLDNARANQCAESANDFTEMLCSTSKHDTESDKNHADDAQPQVIVEVEQQLDSSRSGAGSYDFEVSIINDSGDFTEEILYPCLVCERIDLSDTKYSASKLIDHYHTYHRKKQKPFECFFTDCGWTFTSNYKLDRHLSTHLEPKKIQCTIAGCNKVFSHYDNLKVHKKQHMEAVCRECKLYFNGKREYQMHMRRKHNAGPKHKCPICSQDFKTLPALIQHKHTHKRKKVKHICKKCNKEFRSQSDLVEHRNYHTGQRPYKCKLCQWDFTVESRLRRHMSTHNKKKSIKCPICDKAFNRNEHLAGHMKVHVTSEMATSNSVVENFIQHQLTKALGVDKKYYYCKVDSCKEGFLSFHRYQRHMKSVHGKTAQKPENETKQSAKGNPATYYSDGKTVISSNEQSRDELIERELQVEMNLDDMERVKSSNQSPSFHRNDDCEQSNTQFSFQIAASRNVWSCNSNTSTSQQLARHLSSMNSTLSTPSVVCSKMRPLIPSYERYLIKSNDRDNKSVDSCPISEADLCTNSTTTPAAKPIDSYSTYKINNATSNETFTCEGEDVLSQYIQTPSVHRTVSTSDRKDNLMDDIQKYYVDQNMLSYTENENGMNQACYMIPTCSNVDNSVLTSDIPTNLVLTQNLADMNESGSNFLDEDLVVEPSLNSMTINLNDIK